MGGYWARMIVTCLFVLMGCGSENNLPKGYVDNAFKPIADRVNGGEGDNLHALVVWQKGVTRFEWYGDAPGMAGMLQTERLIGTPERRFNMHEISRTVVAMLTFIAIDEGKIKSTETPIYKYLPSMPKRPKRWRTISVQHALDMETGLNLDEFAISKLRFDHNWNQLNRAEDIMAFIYNQEFADSPGDTFRSSGSATLLLAKALEHVYQKPFEVLAEEKLFSRIGIQDARWLRYLGSQETGIDFGLLLTSSDMIKLGQVILQDGEWGEDNIFNPKWASKVKNLINSDAEFSMHFGRLPELNGALIVQGDGEQYIVISPQKQAVIVSAAGNYHSESKPVLQLVSDLLPILY